MLGIQGFQIKLIIDKIRPQNQSQGRAKINQIWDFLKTVKIRIPILYHQIELECQFSCLKVNAPTLLDELTTNTASEYHKKSPKQRVESNFFKLKTLYLLSWVTASVQTTMLLCTIVQAFSQLIDMQIVGLDTLK